MAEFNAELTAHDNGTAVVAVRGELDIQTVPQLQAVVAPVLAANPTRLVLDVQELAFVDSSGIALWVRWAGEVEELELREPSPLLRRVVSAMGLDRKLHMTG
ncbi:MAG TPA: STAS domain-containing protein [Solirubrobacteraceae bacterium]|nr:STAS domain-containing protein [Solirubrobacteraceae bacterium]